MGLGLLVRSILAWATFLCASSALASDCAAIDVAPFAPQLQGVQLTFVAKDLRDARCWHTSRSDAEARHPPWSTFKIPHLLMALEARVVTSLDTEARWDAERRPAAHHWPDGWKRNQSMRTAFERSAAWYFQDLVLPIGADNYARWLNEFRYGNRAVPLGRDDFWLGGPLAISAREQVAFLACVATTGCGLSARARDMLEAVALAQEKDGNRMYGKTGSGPLKPGDFDGPFEGWYVGYVRDKDAKPVAAFALYARAKGYAGLRSLRRDMSVQMLQHLGLWPR